MKSLKSILSSVLAMSLLIGGSSEAFASSSTLVDAQPVISVGGFNTFVLKADGSVWGFGSDGNSLGTGGNAYSVPTVVMRGVKAVEAGGGNTYFIKNDNSLWACGNNDLGQVGNGMKSNVKEDVSLSDIMPAEYSYSQSVPVKIMDNVKSVSAGGSYGMAIKTDGSLWAWGSNEYGQLGNNGKYNCSNADATYYESKDVPCQTVPVKIMEHVKSVKKYGSSDEAFTFALKEDGTLWGWGRSNFGLMGKDDQTSPMYMIETTDGNAADNDEPIAVISGSKQDKAIKEAEKKSKKESINRNKQATPIKFLDQVTEFNCDGYTMMALRTDNSVWAWGSNESLKISNGSKRVLTPVKFMEDIKQVYLNSLTVSVIKTDNSLWRWSNNDTDQIGKPVKGGTLRMMPVKNMNNIQSIIGHDMILKNDGSLWAWGVVSHGRIGNGDKYTDIITTNVEASGWFPARSYKTKYQASPVKIIDDVVRAYSDGESTFVVKKDGSVWAWGSNGNDGYRLGNGGKRDGRTYDTGDGYVSSAETFYQTTPMKIM